jgi:hypothetical protein
LQVGGSGATFPAEVTMAVVWSAICALSALAAGAQQAQSAGFGPQMRTRVLPGYGYIRYQVLPGDEEAESGEVIVIHEERRSAPPPEAIAPLDEPEQFLPRPSRHEPRSDCSAPRAKLLARLFEVQGMQIEPEFAVWLERNLALGTSGANTVLLGGDPLLISALKADPVARGLAEDLARCEQR